MRKLPTLLFLLLSLPLAAQWQQAAAPPPGAGVDNFLGIAFSSTQIGYVAAYNGRIFKTLNGGQSWSLVYEAPLTNLIVLEGIRFYNTSVGCAYGLNNDGSFGIVSTTDGGQSWHPFGYVVPLSLGRCWDAAWVSATTAYVCGEFGLVLKTTNGGLNWSAVAQTPTDADIISDIEFPTVNTGFVLGVNGVLARTDNGGASWTALGVWDFNHIQFFDAMNGRASGFSGFYQTTDGGFHWQAIAQGVALSDFQLAADQLSGFALGEYPMRTTDGGHTWYTQSFNTPNDHFFDALCTVSPNIGWISGYFTGIGPFLANTGNGGGFGARIVSATDTLGCNGALLHAEAAVINGTPTLAEWLLDDQPIGTGLLLDWSPANLGAGAHTLVFRVSNGNGEIRLYRTVIVPQGPVYSANSFFPASSSLCIGQQTGIYTYLTNSADTFAFFINGQLWQGPKTVNAAQEPFAFTTPVMTDVLDCEVRVQSTCGWDLVSNFQILPKPLPLDNFELSTAQTLLCKTNNIIELKLSGSESNTLYSLYQNEQFYFTSQTGNGGTLYFTSEVFDSTQVFKVKAYNFSTQCEVFQRDSLLVQVERPSAAFYVEEGVNLPNGTPVHLTFTGQEAAAFLWDFGAQALPSSSDQPDPGTIVFDDNAVATIRLITTAPLGCRDTFEQALGLYQPGLLPEDWAMLTPFRSQSFYNYGQAVLVDAQKNIYTHGQRFSSQESFWPSKAGTPGLPLQAGEISLVKYDPYGVYQWSVPFEGFGVPALLDLAGDPAGNLFVALNVPYETVPGDPYQFGSTDARNYKPTRKSFHAALLKYNTKGRFQWVVAMDLPGAFTFERIMALKTDADGNVYFLGSQGHGPNAMLFESIGDSAQMHQVTQDFLAKYDGNGKLLWVADLAPLTQLSWAELSNLNFDPQGNILLCGINYTDPNHRPLLAKLDPQGNLLWKVIPDESAYSFWSMENLTCDSSGNVYVTGYWAYHLSIGPYNFSDSTLSGKKQLFIAKFGPDGAPIWLKSGHSADDVTGHALALYDGQVYVRGNVTGGMDFDSLHITGIGYLGAFLFRLDAADGHLLKYSYFAKSDPNNVYAFYGCDGESIAITPDGRVHLVGGNGYEVDFGAESLNGPDTRYLMKGSPTYVFYGAKEVLAENSFFGRIYPNPAVAAAMLEFHTDTREKLQIRVYDAAGKVVYAFANQDFPAGSHIFRLDAAMQACKPGLHWVVISGARGRSAVLGWVIGLEH